MFLVHLRGDTRSQMNSALKVGIVCCYYGKNSIKPTVNGLARLAESVSATRILHVANDEDSWSGLQNCRKLQAFPHQLVRHDNTGMEFGAYQVGLDTLENFSLDWVVFANDTFATRKKFDAVSRLKLVHELHRSFDWPAVVGQVDSLPRSYRIANLRSHRWVTTNLFAINRTGLQALDHRIYRRELDQLINESADPMTFFSAETDEVLQAHLRAWLFRARPGAHWYASAPLEASNARSMAKKARSIMQEKYLSAYLDNIGAHFADQNRIPPTQKLLRYFLRKLDGIVGNRR